MAAPTLTTERLVLRPWREDDLDAYADLNADPRVMEYYPRTLGRDESRTEGRRIQARLDERGFGGWAVEVVGVAPFIGYLALSKPGFEAHFTPCVEIGWRLAYGHWGRGYASEGARTLRDFAFGPLGLDEIVSFTVPANRRSRAVMERLGMRRDPGEDFDHPLLAEGDALRRHVLYRLKATDRRGDTNPASQDRSTAP